MGDVLIRRYEPEDVEAVRAIYAEATAYADTLQLPYPSLEHWRRKLNPDAPGHHILVAMYDQALVGQLSLEVNQAPRRRHVATLGLGVKTAARQHGVGTALLAAALDLCDHWLNVTRVEIEVYTQNQPALALYTKHGFEVEGTCKNYAFRNGCYADAFLMARLKPAA